MKITIPKNGQPKSGVAMPRGEDIVFPVGVAQTYENQHPTYEGIDPTSAFVDAEVPAAQPQMPHQTKTDFGSFFGTPVSDAPTSNDMFQDADVDLIPSAQAPMTYSPTSMESPAIAYQYNIPPTGTDVSDMTNEQINSLLAQYHKKSENTTIAFAAGIIATIAGAMFDFAPVFLIGFAIIIGSVLSGIKNKRELHIADIEDLVTKRAIATTFDGAEIAHDLSHEKQKVIDEGLKHFYNKKTKGYYNDFSTNDLVWGTMQGNPFEFADVKAEYVWSDSDGHQHRETVFAGQYLRFPTTKTTTCDLYIRRKSDKERKKEKDGGILTDNPEFNAKWHVTSNSAEAALYILTPHFMEHLEKYETIISRELGVIGKTDYIFATDGSFIAYMQTNRTLFEMDLDAKDPQTGRKTGRAKTIEEIERDFSNETQWIRNIMRSLGFGQL